MHTPVGHTFGDGGGGLKFWPHLQVMPHSGGGWGGAVGTEALNMLPDTFSTVAPDLASSHHFSDSAWSQRSIYKPPPPSSHISRPEDEQKL